MTGHKMKPEAKAKLIKALKNHVRTKSHSENISKALVGKNIGKDNGNWRGGRHKSQGRWYIRAINHPLKHQNGYILNSHFVAEQILGRYLISVERIHHINFQKDDDRPENLYLFPSESDHATYHASLKRNKVSPITESNLSNY